MVDFDNPYHRLFQHRIVLEHLVRAFLPVAMAAGVDFERMSRYPAKGHPDRPMRGQRRDGDLIWRLPTALGPDILLYILLEFQATVDRWMALRILVYEGLMLQ